MLYIGEPKDVTRKLLEFIDEFSRVAVYKVNREICCISLYISNKRSESVIKEIIPFHIASKGIKCLGINLTEEIKKGFPGGPDGKESA